MAKRMDNNPVGFSGKCVECVCVWGDNREAFPVGGLSRVDCPVGRSLLSYGTTEYTIHHTILYIPYIYILLRGHKVVLQFNSCGLIAANPTGGVLWQLHSHSLPLWYLHHIHAGTHIIHLYTVGPHPSKLLISNISLYHASYVYIVYNMYIVWLKIISTALSHYKFIQKIIFKKLYPVY